MRLQEFLKQFDSVVVFARFVREARRTWGGVRRDHQHEKELRALLVARDQHIRAYLKRGGRLKLQIGAGTNPLRGWLNTDLEPVSDKVILLDALKAFPFDGQLFEYVFSEHMIEHVPYRGGLFMLCETFRVLKAGGRVRIATPDATKICGLLSAVATEADREYIRWAAGELLGLYADRPSPIQQRRPEWAIDPNHIRRFFPDVSLDCACFVVNNVFRGFGHQFLYDERTLTAALHAAGFVDVRRAKPGTSIDPEFEGLESHGRVIGDAANAFETIVLEAVRP